MIERALDRFSNALLAIGCGFAILMMLHVTADVLGKWLFGHPITGTLEVVTFIYMSACIFLPLGIVQRQRAQITVEVFTHSLPPRALAGLDAVVGLFCGIFVVRSCLAEWALCVDSNAESGNHAGFGSRDADLVRALVSGRRPGMLRNVLPAACIHGRPVRGDGQGKARGSQRCRNAGHQG